MTYLTKVTLDVATAIRLRLRDSYDWHQAVWKAFPGRSGDRRDFLTRLDQEREYFRLLIVSPVEPVRPTWCPPYGWHGSKRIPEAYFARGRYRFQLCANPTRKVAVQNPDGSFKKNGRREPLRNQEELVAWIQRKGDEGGFVVEERTLRTIRRGYETFQKNGIRGLHNAVEFQGVLTVADPMKFREVFTRGIGSAKALGFGLLLIVPTTDGVPSNAREEGRHETDRAAHSSVVSRLVPEPR